MIIVESGKRYIRKDGEITGILLHPNLVDIIYNIEYCEDGRHNCDDDCADLICEYSKEIYDIIKENITLKQEIKNRDTMLYSLQTKYNDDVKLLKSTIISQIEDRDSMLKEMDKMKEYMDDKISRIALALLSSKQDIDEGSIYKAFNDAKLFLLIKDQIDNN